MTHLRVWERHDVGRQAKIQGSLRWTEILVGTPRISLNRAQIAGIRKRVPFRTSAASPAAIRSAFMIEADQTLTATACLLMTQSRPWGDAVYRHEVYRKPGITV